MKALWIFRFAICACVVASGAWAAPLDGNWGVQAAWDNPNARTDAMNSIGITPSLSQITNGSEAGGEALFA